jgi:hypothetical protein
LSFRTGKLSGTAFVIEPPERTICGVVEASGNRYESEVGGNTGRPPFPSAPPAEATPAAAVAPTADAAPAAINN